MTPMERVKAGLCDLKMMSTKGEAHPGAKSTSKRWRQLWVVSPVDTLVIALSGKQTNDDDKNTYQGDAADHYLCGIGHDDAGIARIGRAIERHLWDVKVYNDGAQNYDFNQTPDALVMNAQTRALSFMKSRHHGMAYFTMIDQFCHLGHVLGCGMHVHASVWYGQEPSGGMLTTTSNNRGRTNGLLHAGVKKSAMAGDDNMLFIIHLLILFLHMYIYIYIYIYGRFPRPASIKNTKVDNLACEVNNAYPINRKT